MYGQFKYDSIPANDQSSYSNQQYSIKNTQYSTKNNSNSHNLRYQIKEEPNTLCSSNSSSDHNLVQLNLDEGLHHNVANSNSSNSNNSIIQQSNTQLINSPDQWPINNYYDQNTYYSPLLTPDSQHSIQPALQPIQSTNLACNQTNVQSNLQLNIQLNVQSNLNAIDTNNSPNVQTSIQQAVIQQTTQHQFPNQFINQTDQLQSNKFNQFNNYSPTKDHPLVKKIKTEKNNFTYNNQLSTSTSQVTNIITGSDYFPTQPPNLRPPNAVSRETNFQCNLSYTNQQSNSNFNQTSNRIGDLPSSSTDYYQPQAQQTITNEHVYNQQQKEMNKTDQLDYSNLNNLSNAHQKKLIEPPLTGLANLQSPIVERRNFSSPISTSSSNLESPSSFSSFPLCNQTQTNNASNAATNLNPLHNNSNSHTNYLHNSSVRPLGQNRLNFTSMKSPKSITNPNVKRLIRQELKASIQTRIQQNQLPSNNKLDSGPFFSMNHPSIKLVDKKEMLNCKLNINNNKSNQSKLNKSTSILLDEDKISEEKKIRRRERNKLAATKCRNKKKQHVQLLSEQGRSLELNNKLLHNEMTNLRLEEQRLVQFLLNHKTVCSLKFTMIANQLEQIYQNNQFDSSQNNLDNYNQMNYGRVKIEPDYDQLDNQMTNVPNNHYPNPQVYDDSIGVNVKIENYRTNNFENSSTNQASYESANCFNQPFQPDQINYDQFQPTNTNYCSSTNSIQNLNTNNDNKLTNESSNTNLANAGYLCANDENDVFLMC